MKWVSSKVSSTGNVEDELLGITSVHPMREEAVVEYLTRAKVDWVVIDKLIDEDKLIETEYQNKKFYTRKIQHKSPCIKRTVGNPIEYIEQR